MLSKTISAQFIKNKNLPACINCIFYNSGHLKSSKCSKFGEKDIITGKIIYESAIFSRTNENMCGKSGNYYQESQK